MHGKIKFATLFILLKGYFALESESSAPYSFKKLKVWGKYEHKTEFLHTVQTRRNHRLQWRC